MSKMTRRDRDRGMCFSWAALIPQRSARDAGDSIRRTKVSDEDQLADGRRMLRLQRIVSRGTEPGNADMRDGNPALQFVMTSAMHPIRKPDGRGAGGGLQASEACRVVDDVIWQ